MPPRALRRVECFAVIVRLSGPGVRRLTELLADPLDVIDRLEADAVDRSDPYWNRIEVLMRSALRQVGDVDDEVDAKHLRETGARRTLEAASRYVGFALAFEYLRSRLGTAVVTRRAVSGGEARLMVDDDLWYAPLLKTARGVPREPEPLWEVRSADHHTWLALLRYHGEWGVEAQLFRDGEFVMGCRFNTRAEAVQWAELERRRRMRRSVPVRTTS